MFACVCGLYSLPAWTLFLLLLHAHAASRTEPPCTRVHDAAVSLPVEGRILWGGRRIYGGLFEVLAEGTFPRKDLEHWVFSQTCIFERALRNRWIERMFPRGWWKSIAKCSYILDGNKGTVMLLFFVWAERSFWPFLIQFSFPLPPSSSSPLFHFREKIARFKKGKKETRCRRLLDIGNGNWEREKKNMILLNESFYLLKRNFSIGKWEKLEGQRVQDRSTQAWNMYRYSWILGSFLFIEKFNTRIFYWSLKINSVWIHI